MINSEDYQHPSGITTTTQFRRVDVSELFGKTCSATTVPVTVSVSAPPVGNILVDGAATASVTICTGDTPIFTITGGVASNSYTFKIDGGFDTHTNTPTFDPVALGFVFAPGVTYSVDATIYDKPLSGANPDPTACTNNTSSITIVVTNPPAVALTVTGSINNTFCSGEDLTYTATSIVSATYRFKVDGITRQNSVSNTFTVNNITDGQNINVEITLVSGCTISTATITMIENEITDAGTISGTQQICYNNVPTQLTSVSTATVRYAASNLNYEWYSSTDNVTFNPTGITTLDFQPPALTQTSYFKRVVTSELNNEFCDADSNVLIVEVAPELIGGTILPLNDQYLCFDPLAPPIIPPASLSVTNSIVDPLITYQWQESSDTISWTNIGGEVNQTFNPPVLTSSQTIYYRRMVRALGGGAGCEEFSTVHTLFVSDLDPGEIDTASNETYCFGTNPPIIGSTIDASSSSGPVSYQWESRTAGTAYAPIGGATLNSYDPGILTETTWFKRTVSSNISLTTCELESNEVIIEILNEVNTGNILTSQVICENTIPNDLNLVGADAGGSVSYQWESSLDYLNWSEVTGEVGNTLSFSSVATQTTYYRVVITNATNSPTVLDPNQMQLSLTRIANPLKVGENYTVVIGTNTYSFTTTNIASDTNDIGTALANL